MNWKFLTNKARISPTNNDIKPNIEDKSNLICSFCNCSGTDIEDSNELRKALRYTCQEIRGIDNIQPIG